MILDKDDYNNDDDDGDVTLLYGREICAVCITTNSTKKETIQLS